MLSKSTGWQVDLMGGSSQGGSRRSTVVSNNRGIASFVMNPTLLAFARLFCGESEGVFPRNGVSDFSAFCGFALYQCLLRDAPELLSTYMDIYTALRNFADRFSVIH